MPTHESKYGIGDRVTHRGIPSNIAAIEIDARGVHYRLSTGPLVGDSDIEPAPPEPEVWPRMVASPPDGFVLAYADGRFSAYIDEQTAERGARLERLAWLSGMAEIGALTQDGHVERRGLIDYFRRYHGPSGEVYLEPRGKS